jgi:ribosome maturation factor RimP
MAQGGRAVGRGRSSAPKRGEKPRIAAAPPADLTRVRDDVHDLVEPVLNDAGYDLDGLVIKKIGRRHLLKITVDGDGGVNLDVIADLSRAMARALDEAEESGREVIPGEYQLEVSSPGVDRPLTLARHWRRSIGRLVAVKAGEKQITGRVLAADERSVTLDVNGAKRGYALADLGPGRVQIEFNRLDDVADEDLDEFEGHEEDDLAGDDDEEDVEEQ